MSEEQNERNTLDARLWAAVITAVLSGFSGTWYSYRTASELEGKVVDRYYGKDAARDFQLRDTEIRYLRENLTKLRTDFEEFKRNVPPKIVADTLNDHETRLRSAEKQLYILRRTK